MAYARAFVSGFEMGSIADLICFADVFGASRLRYMISSILMNIVICYCTCNGAIILNLDTRP